MNLGVAIALGALALAVFALRPEQAPAETDEFGRALDIAAAGAGVWTVAAAATGLFAFSSVSYIPITLDDSLRPGPRRLPDADRARPRLADHDPGRRGRSPCSASPCAT